MGDIKVARDFVRSYLPKEIVQMIDLTTIKPDKDSFIEKELQEYFSDLLLHVTFKGKESCLYLLFEHKSYLYKPISLQLLKYMVMIWERALNKEKAVELPIILPLVVYHGESLWQIPKSFKTSFAAMEESAALFEKYIPEFKYLLYDLSPMSKEEIRGEAKLRIYLDISRAIHENDIEKLKETVKRAMIAFAELGKDGEATEYFEAYILYILNVRRDLGVEEIHKVIKEVSEERGEKMLTIAERLINEGMEKGMEKGRQEGMEKGMEKGKNVGKEELLWKQILKKFPKTQRTYYEKVKTLSTDQLDILGLELIDMKDPKELDRFF